MEPLSSLIGGVLLGWLWESLFQGGTAGLKKLLSQPPAQQAIKATADEFPFMPEVEPALKKWCQSDEFVRLLADIHTGLPQASGEALVESFITVGEFHHGFTDLTEHAARVLLAFERHLVIKLLMSPAGPVVGFMRAEERHRELLERIEGVDRKIDGQRLEPEAPAPPRPSAFVTAAQFFRPYLWRQRFFHHAWRTVGRHEEVVALDEFVGSTEYRVAVITGPTGVGKTKINFAFARGFQRRHKGYELRFVAEGVSVNDSSFAEIPDAPCVIVADDAHRREDIKLLLEGARQRPQPSKIILIARPWGLTKLDLLLDQTSYDPSEIRRLPEIRPLTHEELTRLAAQALGRDYAGYAERLVRETNESPLFIVLGGKVIKKERLPPKLFLSSEDFLKILLTRYSDLILGEISARFGVEISRRLIKLLAALGPFGEKDKSLRRAMAEFLRMDEPEMIAAMDELQEAGFLARRGYSLKFIPDFIAEHILEDASLTSKGEPTGYADQVYEAFGSFGSARVFRNLAELDWRVRKLRAPDTELLDNVWWKIDERFRASDHFERKNMLDSVQAVSYIQPRRVLALAEFAMHNPAPETEGEMQKYFRFTHEHVLKALPRVLAGVARNEEYLARCCELLWDLAGSEPDVRKAAVSELKNLARYGTYPGVDEQVVVLESADRWLGEPTPERVSPALDVVDQVLRKTDHADHSGGGKIVTQALTVRSEPTRELRQSALRIIRRCAASDDVRVVLRAIQSYGNALSDPMPIINQVISDEDRLQWLPEQRVILEAIEDVVTRNNNPFVQLGVAEVLEWEALRAPEPEIRSKVRSIVEHIPDSYEIRLAQALNFEFDYLHLRVDLEAGKEEEEAVEEHDRRLLAVKEMCSALADEFISKNPDPADGLGQLNHWMRLIDESGWKPRSWTLWNTFLQDIAYKHPEYAASMCEALVSEPDCVIAPRVGDLLMVLRGKSPQPALRLCRSFLETKHKSLCYAVAQSFASGTWIQTAESEDFEIFRSLITDPRPAIKKVAIKSLRQVFGVDMELALHLATTTDTDGDAELIDSLLRVFDEKYGIHPDRLSDQQLRTLLSKLEPLNELDGKHSLDKFLTYVATRMPLEMVKMLLNRVRRREAGDFRYEPVPEHGISLKLRGLASRDDYPQILRDVRDMSLASGGETMLGLANLFKALSLDFNEEGLAALNEWIESGEPEKIKEALLLLDGVKPPFSFERVDFVANALRKAEAAGEECYRIAQGVFAGGAVPTERHRIIGQPPPSVVRQLEQASAVLGCLQPGTPEHRFYEYVVKDAEKTLRDEEASDEELRNYY
jgi:hypothetical protein